ncbi:MAG: hypothetical protein E2O68_07860 [Deltaproteobacteria bacterium]|nr:MAG: hypothetical protein E2O68_07860 [Deltaproteobacteria bacterium]
MIKIFFLLFFVCSCMAPEGPEQALRNFINYRFSGDQTREKLLDMSAGNLQAQIEVLDEESFAKIYKVSDIKLKRVKINLKNCNEESCSITYTLSFSTLRKGNEIFRSEVKKIADMVKVDGSWKVSDVTNIKTYIDSKEPITP